ncbi:MAG: DnaA/Hda family protein [Rickettsiales bacterium]
MSQVPFNIKSSPSYLEDDFFVSDVNVFAKKWVDSWPNWGEGGLNKIFVLIGEEGSGKTHLANIWGERANAIELNISNIVNKTYNSSESDNFVFEDVHKYQSYAEDIFYLLNYVINNGKYLFITSSKSIKLIDFKLKDLSSRLSGAILVDLLSPDENVISQVIMKYFSDRQMRIDQKTIKFLSVRVPRSYPNVKKILEEIDYLSLKNKMPVTIPFLQKYFDLI